VPADKLQITLAGRGHVVEAGTTAGQALEGAGGLAATSRNAAPGAGAVIAARVNGELRDLAYQLADGDVVEPVELGSDAGLAIMRHSAAHVMAQAVQDIFPEAKLGIGPPIENGFYYDFDVASAFGPDDLKNIEQRMRQIVKQGQLFSRRVVTDADARAELADEPYKLELIGLKGAGRIDAEESVEVGGAELTIYDNLDAASGELMWKDLCRGPHLPSTRQIPAVKVMRSSGAYWRGSEKNPQLQRIYGTACRPARRRTGTWPCWPRPSAATTASSAPSWTCSRSRPRSAAGCRYSTPRAGSSGGCSRTTRGSGTWPQATNS